MRTADHQLLFLPPVQPLVQRFGRDFFRTAPDQPGVYLMCGAAEGVLYVGKARNLRKRLASYCSANCERLPRKLRRLLMAVERIHWDICCDEATAISRERDLLLALRPRFNSVGTYPAPPLHLGWQRTNLGLAVGCANATEDYERCQGPFRRLRPAYAALLRLVWRVLNSSVSIHELPRRLLGDAPPARWVFGTERADQKNRANELVEYLDGFWRGESIDLVAWLLQSSPAGSLFEEQWRAQDAECLLKFFERVIRRRKDADAESTLLEERRRREVHG